MYCRTRLLLVRTLLVHCCLGLPPPAVCVVVTVGELGVTGILPGSMAKLKGATVGNLATEADSEAETSANKADLGQEEDCDISTVPETSPSVSRTIGTKDTDDQLEKNKGGRAAPTKEDVC